MPSYYILIAHPHKGGAPTIVAGPEIPYSEQREKFKKEFQSVKVHKEFKAVELLDSRVGIVKRTVLVSPADMKKRDEAREKETIPPAPDNSAEE